MEQVGKYKILAHIGHGAMGSVEKAEAPDGTIVAIKILFPQFIYEDEYLRRFKREAELAKKLSHPNVVKILEIGEDQNGKRQYIVMEYIDSKTLAEYMHDKGMASVAIKHSSKLSEKIKDDSQGKNTSPKSPSATTFSAKETIKIIRQLAGVLQAAEDIGLLHRDIKPQNILLDKRGNVKLLDFGLAKDTEALVSVLSMTGQSIGTPPYMSPEQHDGHKDIDIRSDLYSLGCTAYHMLTGKPPFSGPTASAFARQHCDDIPEPVHKINPACPLNLSQVIDRLLAKKSENRHQNPTELIEDLNRIERGEVPLKLYKSKKSKKHNPLITWAYVAAAVIIVTGCFIGLNLYKRNNAKTIIAEAVSDARQLAVEHKFKEAKNVLDDIISEYTESNPDKIEQAQALRTKLIEQHGEWIIGEAARKQQKETVELTRAETLRKRNLHNCLRNAARLKNNENRVKEATVLVNKAYQLCNTDDERAKVATVEKQVQEALAKIRSWAAVADFTLDKSVEAKLTGSAVAVKLEQALGRKYRLVTRRQVKKVLQELRFQASDLADKSKAKQFGKMVGAEYLITGSVIQLGREITVACQIFNIETGAIRQTAEVSALSVDDFNYMIREAANILGMSDTEKRKYMNKKFNYPKHLKAGNRAFLSGDYDSAVKYFKQALSAKRTDETENMLNLATEKAEAQRIFNERKAKYELTIKQGNKLLKVHKWKEAEAKFIEAQKNPGYEYENQAIEGIKHARGGAELYRKNKSSSIFPRSRIGRYLKKGMVSWYDLAKNAKDNHGSNNGKVYGNVRFDGESASFDGNEDFITLLPSRYIPSYGTFSFWLKSGLSKHCQIFGSINNPSGGKDGYLTWVDPNGSIGFYLYQYNSQSNVVSVPKRTFSANKWIHVVFTMDKNSFGKAYINGKLVAEKKLGVLANRHDLSLMLGKSCNYQQHDLVGNVKDFAVWSRPLSLKEVKYIYNNKQGRSYIEL